MRAEGNPRLPLVDRRLPLASLCVRLIAEMGVLMHATENPSLLGKVAHRRLAAHAILLNANVI